MSNQFRQPFVNNNYPSSNLNYPCNNFSYPSNYFNYPSANLNYPPMNYNYQSVEANHNNSTMKGNFRKMSTITDAGRDNSIFRLQKVAFYNLNRYMECLTITLALALLITSKKLN